MIVFLLRLDTSYQVKIVVVVVVVVAAAAAEAVVLDSNYWI